MRRGGRGGKGDVFQFYALASFPVHRNALLLLAETVGLDNIALLPLPTTLQLTLGLKITVVQGKKKSTQAGNRMVEEEGTGGGLDARNHGLLALSALSPLSSKLLP